MSELNVASNKALQTAIGIYEWMNDVFKSFGIVAGGFAASTADWVFGSVTMATLLSNYSGFQYGWTKWVVGGVFSLALWGIQIILWQLVLSGKVKKMAPNRETGLTMTAIVFLVIVAMKLGDDFSDIVGVYWLIKDNPMRLLFDPALYNSLLGVIFFLVWVICGFAEVFVAISINLLKNGGGQGGGRNNNNQQNQQQRHEQGRREGDRGMQFPPKGGDQGKKHGDPRAREAHLDELRKKYGLSESRQEVRQ